MRINSIKVTQRKLKRKELLEHLTALVLMNAYIDPIQLVQLEDQTVYVKDGHHRLAAYAKAGRTTLHPLEYDLLFLDETRPTFGNIQKLLA